MLAVAHGLQKFGPVFHSVVPSTYAFPIRTRKGSNSLRTVSFPSFVLVLQLLATFIEIVPVFCKEDDGLSKKFSRLM